MENYKLFVNWNQPVNYSGKLEAESECWLADSFKVCF